MPFEFIETRFSNCVHQATSISIAFTLGHLWHFDLYDFDFECYQCVTLHFGITLTRSASRYSLSVNSMIIYCISINFTLFRFHSNTISFQLKGICTTIWCMVKFQSIKAVSLHSEERQRWFRIDEIEMHIWNPILSIIIIIIIMNMWMRSFSSFSHSHGINSAIQISQLLRFWIDDMWIVHIRYACRRYTQIHSNAWMMEGVE